MRHMFTILIALYLCCGASVFAGGNKSIPLSELISRSGMQLVSDAGSLPLRLKSTEAELVFAPGLKTVVVNGKPHKLLASPSYRNGELVLPEELLELLPSSINLREYSAVVIDPGHGGRDSGATAGRLLEKNIVLDISMRVSGILASRGVPVVMTREDDRAVSLDQRSRIANRTPSSLFVSIHANSAGDDRDVEGVETFILCSRITDSARAGNAVSDYDLQAEGPGGTTILKGNKARITATRISEQSREEASRLADSVQRQLVVASGEPDRKVKEKNLAVLRETYFSPAILVEVGFITNPKTAKKLGTSGYRQKLAEAIANGILEFLRR